MKLFRQKLRILSIAVCSALLVASAPQFAKANTSGAKLEGIRQVVASSGFWGGNSFALGKDGTVWAWGSNIFGQFANGTAGPEGWTITPHRLAALEHTKQLLIGNGYYLARKEDGRVVVWGNFVQNNADVIVGKQHRVLPPQPVGGLTEVVQIAGGPTEFLALQKNGTVLQWQGPEYSNSGFTTVAPAGEVAGLSGVQRIESGGFHAALRDNGTLWIWSADAQSVFNKLPKTPTMVKDLYHVKSISIKEGSLLALTANGSVWASVNAGSHSSAGLSMKKMGNLSGIVSIQTGNGFNLVQNKKGEYWLWRAGTNLQSLQKVTAISGISRLTLDLNGFVAVKKDGTVWTWQHSYLSDKLTFTQPKQLKGLQSPVAFATGENSKYALLKDGTVAAWGTNMFGQLGISVLESRPFTVSPVLKPVTLVINGKRIEPMQPPIYLNGKVMVPIREVAESLGYDVAWDGNFKLGKNGKSVTINTESLMPPTIKVSYTSLVPAGALAQSLGLSAKWDSSLYQLTLSLE